VLHAALIAPLFSAEVATEEARPELVDSQLFADELAYLARAVPKRRAEFGTARLCARRALARLGITAGSLVPHEDRAPRWPDGSVGSLTHTHEYCAAVVASTATHVSLGVDAERERALDAPLIEMICTARERERTPASDAIVIFAAKEAFYKCQYPLTRTYLDFLDVDLYLDHARGTFEVEVHKPLPRALGGIQGRFMRVGGLVLCSSELRR
jgi:4'-phosphopantetheinyl transferase EntD